MRSVGQIRGTAAPYPRTNVDTDEIVPARFLLRDRKQGFADSLFHDLRFDAAGAERPAFVLNQPCYRDASVLIAGMNFGCGSSREHAVWALLDCGIEAVIAPSFGDIFRNNAVQNGLLLVPLVPAEVDHLLDLHRVRPEATIRVDLPAQTVDAADGQSFRFDIAMNDKERLLKGRSQIDETLALQAEIDRFEAEYAARFPWAMRL
jgi:3-isopropylmalate/(R)-2-methylmalate dehydratase small subunit